MAALALDHARDPRHGFGVACLLVASLFTSMAGILLRWMEQADGWQVLFYRSASFVIVLLAYIAWRHRGGTLRAFTSIGWPGLAIALALGMSFITFIMALLETTVANVVFINGSSPFFAALFGWLALREPVRRAVWLAMAAAFAGIAVMFTGGLAHGSLTGDLLSIVCCLGYAVTLVAFRCGKAVDMLPAVCLAGVVSMIVAVPFMEGFRLTAHDFALAIILGVVQLGLQYILVTAGSRHVRAAEIALIGRTTLVLSPLWVWIGVGEVPTAATLAGGAVVLAAVLGQALWTLRTGVNGLSP